MDRVYADKAPGRCCKTAPSRHSEKAFATYGMGTIQGYQRTIGNQAVIRLMRSGELKAQPATGRADGKYEREEGPKGKYNPADRLDTVDELVSSLREAAELSTMARPQFPDAADIMDGLEKWFTVMGNPRKMLDLAEGRERAIAHMRVDFLRERIAGLSIRVRSAMYFRPDKPMGRSDWEGTIKLMVELRPYLEMLNHSPPESRSFHLGGLIEGKELISHWLHGDGKPKIYSDDRWAEYMMANKLLPLDIVSRLSMDAARRKESGSFAYRYHAEVEEGYVTGYQLLHGTNRDKGDFTMAGEATVSRRPDGSLEIRYRVHYEFNDRFDLKKIYFMDNAVGVAAKAVTAVTPGMNPVDYDLKIAWDADCRIKKGTDNTMTEALGYPFWHYPGLLGHTGQTPNTP